MPPAAGLPFVVSTRADSTSFKASGCAAHIDLSVVSKRERVAVLSASSSAGWRSPRPVVGGAAMMSWLGKMKTDIVFVVSSLRVLYRSLARRRQAHLMHSTSDHSEYHKSDGICNYKSW